MPLYVESRKKDVETINYLFPIFHLRHGDGLNGWQFWPIVGHEHKVPTLRTNSWGDEVPAPGHDRKFVLWPFFLNQRAGLGGTNEAHTQAVLPLYTFTRSPNRDATAIPFVLGWSSVHDREKKYDELGAPWPFIVFRRGESARTDRVWPFYSRATNQFLESSWILWPIYKYNRVHSDPLDRDRMRILLFLYSDTTERNTETWQRPPPPGFLAALHTSARLGRQRAIANPRAAGADHARTTRASSATIRRSGPCGGTRKTGRRAHAANRFSGTSIGGIRQLTAARRPCYSG